MLILSIMLLAATEEPRTIVRDTPERAASDRDTVVCKRFAKTGSLIGTYRTCKPKSEWERERDNIRQLNVADSCRSRGDGLGC